MTCILDKKPAVNWDVCMEIQAAQLTIKAAYDEMGYGCVVTSARDGKHSKKTAHTHGRALDLRILHIPKSKWPALAKSLSEELNQFAAGQGWTGRFFVVLETDLFKEKKQIRWAHIHMEWSDGTPNIKSYAAGKYLYLPPIA